MREKSSVSRAMLLDQPYGRIICCILFWKEEENIRLRRGHFI